MEDVKSGLMARQGLDQFIPFRLLNPWGNRVLSVTDLTGGMWCEVSVEYRKLYRHLKNSQEWKKMEDKGSPVVLKTETMKKGSEVHLKKGKCGEAARNRERAGKRGGVGEHLTIASFECP